MKLKTTRKWIAFISLIITSTTILIQCNSHHNENTSENAKMGLNDPFKNTIAKSEFFEINTAKDTVIEGSKGTRIALPANCFRNENGETVSGQIKFELSEALSLDDMILSNLTTSSDGKPLETDGMLYMNASSGDNKLHIDSTKPLYIEIPTKNKKPGMMVYKGKRDEKGNMNWTSPKPMENYLVSIDLDLLDFLPEGFKIEVDKGMPFHNHKFATKELVDSLYYSLSAYRDMDTGTLEKYSEPYYNSQKEIKNGKYTSKSYEQITKNNAGMTFVYKNNKTGEEKEISMEAIAKMGALARQDLDKNYTFIDRKDNIMREDTMSGGNPLDRCGIDPASIKTIKSKKFQNTLISTREFETRLQYIFKSCDNRILNLYTHNLDKNMWEIDKLAVGVLPESKNSGKDTTSFSLRGKFIEFAAQKLTRVEGTPPNAKLMADYFEKRLKTIKGELEKVSEEARKITEKENKIFAEIADKYKDILWKREKYRMEKYGYKWTELGWSNIDKAAEPNVGNQIASIWKPTQLNIVVNNPEGCDRVYSYVVYESIKSLYKMNSEDNKNFYVGNIDDKEMRMPKNARASIICIGYKDASLYFGAKNFETENRDNISITLLSSNEAYIKEGLAKYDDYESENKINVDLEYQAVFAQKEVRQKKVIKEQEFMSQLRSIALPCCISSNPLLPEEQPSITPAQ